MPFADKTATILSINAFLGALYVISSYLIWFELDKWSRWNIASLWNPILVQPYHIPNTPQVLMPIFPLWNVPFILFVIMLAVNVFYLLKLHGSKQAKIIPATL